MATVKDDKTTHTPGPWGWNPTAPGCYAVTTIVRDFPGTPEMVVAEVYADVDPHEDRIVPDKEGAANARLIAAAPDLLASLREMEDMLHRWMRDNTGPHELDVLERCEQAIAKAEGHGE